MSDGPAAVIVNEAGTNIAEVKGASTAAVAADKALVVAVSPNNILPVNPGAGNVVDANNSSVTPLGSNATFTGAATDVTGYAQVSVVVFADQPSAANGFKLQFSLDGTNWDGEADQTTVAGVAATRSASPVAKWFRVVFTNSGSAQSVFRLQTVLRTSTGVGALVDVEAIPVPGDRAQLTQSVIIGKTTGGGGAYVPVKVTPSGALTTEAKISDPLPAGNNNIGDVDVASVPAPLSTTGGGTEAAALRVTLANDSTGLVSVDDNGGSLTVDTPQLPGALVGGRLDVNVGAALPTGTNEIGKVAQGTPAANASAWPIFDYDIRTDRHGGITLANMKEVAETWRLCGGHFTDTTLDTTEWATSLVGSGTAPVAGGVLDLGTGVTANSQAIVNGNFTAGFTTAQANGWAGLVRVGDTGATNNTRRWGAFTTTNGFFFQLSGTTFSIVVRSGGSDTVISSGSFNGTLGPSYALDTNFHVFQIQYVGSTALFLIDRQPLHRYSVTNTALASNLTVPNRAENVNSSGGTSDVHLYARTLSISRHGQLETFRASESFTDNTILQAVKSLIGGRKNDGTYVTAAFDANGNLKVVASVSAGTATAIVAAATLVTNGTNYFEYVVPGGQSFKLTSFYTGGVAITGATGAVRAALLVHDDSVVNFVSNGDFENAGQVTPWAAVTGSFTAPSPDSSAVQFFTGAASMRWIYTNSATALRRRQTFGTVQDFSGYRYVRARFFHDNPAAGVNRTISIVLTSGTSTRTYSIGPIAIGTTPFNTPNSWITLLADLDSPTSTTGTTFDIQSINSIDLMLQDSGNRSGTVYWDSVQFVDQLTTRHRLFSGDGSTVSVPLAPEAFAAGVKLYLRTKNTSNGTIEFGTVANGTLEAV